MNRRGHGEDSLCVVGSERPQQPQGPHWHIMGPPLYDQQPLLPAQLQAPGVQVTPQGRHSLQLHSASRLERASKPRSPPNQFLLPMVMLAGVQVSAMGTAATLVEIVATARVKRENFILKVGRREVTMGSKGGVVVEGPGPCGETFGSRLGMRRRGEREKSTTRGGYIEQTSTCAMCQGRLRGNK